LFDQRNRFVPLRGQPGELRRGVVLFPDTFTDYYEPETAFALGHLLFAAGCTLRPAGGDAGTDGRDGDRWPHGLRCCGRPLISNGLLDRAVQNARHNVRRLHEASGSGVPIVACEPSCILTIKDDYPALLRGEERRQAEVVAAACRTVEEFLDEALSAKDAPPVRFRPGPKQILVHAHCHQRALVGVGPLLRLLRRIPGAEVIDLDAGCCGMAGSFGYEKEHYEVSRLVGEQRLFPALRQAPPDAVVVAPGFSCRHQIAHFTGRTALHPVQLLQTLLDASSDS
jgi:Fe-S oxidoreductase